MIAVLVHVAVGELRGGRGAGAEGDLRFQYQIAGVDLAVLVEVAVAGIGAAVQRVGAFGDLPRCR